LGAEDHDPVFADLCHRNCNRAAHKPCLLQSPAKTLGLTVPNSMQLLAKEVIE
jgi:hypothetical protein